MNYFDKYRVVPTHHTAANVPTDPNVSLEFPCGKIYNGLPLIVDGVFPVHEQQALSELGLMYFVNSSEEPAESLAALYQAQETHRAIYPISMVNSGVVKFDEFYKAVVDKTKVKYALLDVDGVDLRDAAEMITVLKRDYPGVVMFAGPVNSYRHQGSILENAGADLVIYGLTTPSVTEAIARLSGVELDPIETLGESNSRCGAYFKFEKPSDVIKAMIAGADMCVIGADLLGDNYTIEQLLLGLKMACAYTECASVSELWRARLERV